MATITTDFRLAVATLSEGDVVAIPTETVYGLAGNIYNEKAIRKIYSLKQRPLFNPLIVHVGSVQKVHELVSYFPDAAKKLADAFWPGPLTIVLPKKAVVPDLITAGKSSVAIRIPNHPVTLELLQKLPFPLAAPSANKFGNISPTQSAHVESAFKTELSLILEGGSCASGIESTIIGFENNLPVIYRLGALSVEDLEAVIGPLPVKNKNAVAPEAPGMLERHYAPITKTYFTDDVDALIREFQDKKIGLMTFTEKQSKKYVAHHIVLSKCGNFKEAAAHLYKALHELDRLDLDLIIVEKFPDINLGRSINDRLMRASK